MSDLTEKQKEFVDDLAMQQVNSMNNDDVFIHAVEQKVNEMETHVKEYFHQRLHFHRQNKNNSSTK
ncbi:hypothetical protein [Moellerella wisconsensis]|uniref:Uncharacterized protein n=1 Tax=Moellerella wisconsensis ATCC 35017 TaxID=1354267 RepID=A0A0N0IB63_9GAMM|nr:hypothetical protein [Moellerella wisconsensis]KPD03623.1 hypothetical protein M992_0913 [Moellerella wisconsensis ATCC 35017]VFS50544.1 Uncharacterised protein [Moellerella wisconsensis]